MIATAAEPFVAHLFLLLFLLMDVLANEHCLPSDSSFCRCSTKNITLDLTQIGLSYPSVYIQLIC